MEKDECIYMALIVEILPTALSYCSNTNDVRKKDNNCTTTASLATAKVEKSGTLR